MRTCYCSHNMSVFLGAIAGTAAGAILLALSHIAPRFGARIPVRDLDQVCILGHDCSRREAHLIGMLLHLSLSLVFGALYTLGIQQGVITHHLWWLAVHAVAITLFVGLVVMPLEGHGLFGTKEDPWFVADLVITNILWTALFGIILAWLA